MTEPAFLAHTRAGYDAMAPHYAEQFGATLTGRPWDRAMVAGFAEAVDGPVADVGCGPGGTTAYLTELGVDVLGVDLSPRTVELARRRHPGLRFAVGSMTALPLGCGVLGGVAALYSIIHVPPPYLPGVLAEFSRVLVPGGHLMLAFQVGDEVRHRDEGWGHRICVDWHRLQPDRVAALLDDAGFRTVLRLVREPAAFPGGSESTQQAYLVARRS